MKKFIPFTTLLSLVIIWSFFYAGIKYFLWGVLADSPTPPTLETITGYILLWSSIAYLIGGSLYTYASRKMILLFCGICAILITVAAGKFIGNSEIAFKVIITCIGFLYGIWVVSKNTLLSLEIWALGYDATIGGILNIIFTVSLIIGTVSWAKLGESVGTESIGIFIFTGLLALGCFIIPFIRTEPDNLTASVKNSPWKGISGILIRYGFLIFTLGLLWQIITEASQVAISGAEIIFSKTKAEASLLLLYSSIGVILGNILSMKLVRIRKTAFILLGGILALLLFSFSTTFNYASSQELYILIPIFAGLLGFFFGGTVNLAESYYFSLLSTDTDREYGSAIYGFILSMIWTILMFSAHWIRVESGYGMIGVSVFLGVLTIIAIGSAAKKLQV